VAKLAKNENLYALIEARMPSDRQACAIETHDAKYYSWRDLEAATAKLANLLASLGLPAGSRIAVQVDKSPEALFLYLAALRAGHVFLPLNNAYQQAEIDYFVGNAEPAVIVCTAANLSWIEAVAHAHGVRHVYTLGEDRRGSLLEAAAPMPETFDTVRCSHDDLAAILYTSGTTGRSKGAMLSHGNLSSNAQVLDQYWRWRRGDVLLHALPIFHVHGLFVATHCALLSATPMIFMARFDAAAVREALPRATVMMGVPTFYTRLLERGDVDRESCRGMRLFVSGSAPLTEQTFTAFEARTGHRILERYGMSETMMITSNPLAGERVPGTVGFPLPGVEVRIAAADGTLLGPDEVGVIEVRGPNVCAGYWRMPEKTAEEFRADGFFITGDLGTMDAGGRVTIVGRSKDLVISGGFNVYPKEIERLLDELPGVAESAVIGVPHPDFGEAVVAVLVARAGDEPPNEAAVRAALDGRLARFKQPKATFVVDDLPRNAMGKVQKNELRNRFADLFTAPAG
jgi:malonyl-CoA/methylmalonyl-CoA synthetase